MSSKLVRAVISDGRWGQSPPVLTPAPQMAPSAPGEPFNVDVSRETARKQLDPCVYAYFAGGAGTSTRWFGDGIMNDQTG
jgi:hypothetical protein